MLPVNSAKQVIHYGISSTVFGECLISFCGNEIYFLEFIEFGNQDSLLEEIQALFPHSEFLEKSEKAQELVERIFSNKAELIRGLTLKIQGTDFQKKVWKVLLEIKEGTTSTYSELAEKIGQKTASRAVANAIGANHIAYLIPCHRVIRKDGTLGGYKWGLETKKALLRWEDKMAS